MFIPIVLYRDSVRIWISAMIFALVGASTLTCIGVIRHLLGGMIIDLMADQITNRLRTHFDDAAQIQGKSRRHLRPVTSGKDGRHGLG